MKRELVFDGEKGPMRLRMLWSMVSVGIALLSRDNKRTTDDMRRELAIQKGLEGVSCDWDRALELGVAPQDLLDQREADLTASAKKGEPLGEWTPRVATGEEMRFLLPDPQSVRLDVKTFERLEALVERAAPQTGPSNTADAVDVLDFLTAAAKLED